MRFIPFALLLLTWPCLADSTRPLREARSENREYRLLIERTDQREAEEREAGAAKESSDQRSEDRDAARADDSQSADADSVDAEHDSGAGEQKNSRSSKRENLAQDGVEARLVQAARGADEHEVWAIRLVNPIAPIQAFVHDHGTWVVTLDDFPNGGARHALVIYDAEGRATHEFSVDELVPRGDRSHVKRKGDKVEWMSGARGRFLDGDEFELRLRWGTTLTIDLREGRIEHSSRKHGKKEDEAGDDAGEEASVADEDANASAEEMMQAKLDELQALAAAATDPNEIKRIAAEMDAIRANLDALEAVRSFGTDVDLDGELSELAQAAVERAAADAKLQELFERQAAGDTDATLPEQIDLASAQVGALRAAESQSANEISKEMLAADSAAAPAPQVSEVLSQAETVSDSAGNSAAAGLAVPMPNAAQHFDYVAWMNQRATPGSGDLTAQGALAEAAKSVVPFEGDSDLFDRAMDGDPAALATPEIRAWVEANRGAIDALGNARFHEYHGMPMRSDDGSMIGILLPNLAPWRQGVKATVMDGKLLEADGRPQDAVRRYLGAMSSGAQFSQGPTLIENLVGVASQSLGQQALLDSYANNGANLDYTSIAAHMDAEVYGTQPVSETFQSERAMVLDAVQRSFQFDPETQSYSVDPEYVSSVLGLAGQGGLDGVMTGLSLQHAGFDATVAAVNEHYDHLTSAAQLPYPQAQTAFREFEAQISDPAFKAQNPFLSTLLPALSRASFLTTRNEAGLRAARLITELKAYQQTTGTLPDSLDALGHRGFEIDPFTQQQFGFRREGNDFVVYSKGANGTDEGGVNDSRGETNDILYWPRPPKAGPR